MLRSVQNLPKLLQHRICCDKIIKYGNDVDLTCYEGKKAIEYARERRWRSTTQTLVRFGLDEVPKPRGRRQKKTEAEKEAERIVIFASQSEDLNKFGSEKVEVGFSCRRC